MMPPSLTITAPNGPPPPAFMCLKRSPHECPFDDHDRPIRSPEWFDASSHWSALAISVTP
jgi:hypothetical protein